MFEGLLSSLVLVKGEHPFICYWHLLCVFIGSFIYFYLKHSESISTFYASVLIHGLFPSFSVMNDLCKFASAICMISFAELQN